MSTKQFSLWHDEDFPAKQKVIQRAVKNIILSPEEERVFRAKMAHDDPFDVFKQMTPERYSELLDYYCKLGGFTWKG